VWSHNQQAEHDRVKRDSRSRRPLQGAPLSSGSSKLDFAEMQQRFSHDQVRSKDAAN
jgi:hypothetical protein